MASIAGKIFSLHVHMWRHTTLRFIIQPDFYFELSILDCWKNLAWLFLSFFFFFSVKAGWGRHVNPRPFHFNVWQNSLQAWLFLEFFPPLLELLCGSVGFTQHSATGWRYLVPLSLLIPSNSTWDTCFSLQDCHHAFRCTLSVTFFREFCHSLTQVQSLGQEDPLEKGMATHSSILAWRIPWTEEPGRLQSMRTQKVEYDWVTNSFTFSLYLFVPSTTRK